MGKFLIINADDFGMSTEANQAILELLKEGKLSCASLMPNGLCYDEAIRMIRENELKDIGIHLTVTRDGFEIEKRLMYGKLSSAKSIADENGELYTDAAILMKNCKFSDLVRECEQQLKRVMADGIEFTHVDNHMYSLFPAGKLKGYLAVFCAYLRQCGKVKMRWVRFAKHYKPIADLFPIWSGRKLKPVLSLLTSILNLRGLDYAYAFPYNAGGVPTLEDKKRCFESFLSNLPEGITELHIHPFIDSPSLREYNPKWQNRVHEYEMLKEMDLQFLMDKYGVTLISYCDLLRRE